MTDPQPYAYQAWHCGACEIADMGPGSIVDSPPGQEPAMYCEACGAGYDSRGRYVPDPEDDDDA